MFSRSQTVVSGGTFIDQSRASKGIDTLMEWVATGAFHNSDELYDAPKCHPHTRVAVLDRIMEWVSESESARDEFMMWLFGPAGAGKSAIAKRIAEIAAERRLLIATFFFSRTSPTRGNKDRLIATLAYQLAQSIPETRSYIEDAIERDPTIFRKNIPTQINTLFIEPFQSILSSRIIPSQKLIIIDGLDECNDSKAQVTILEAISHSFTQHKLPIVFLLVSRPEPDIDTLFKCNEPLRFIHHRLALDDSYKPNDDIRLFFSDRFEHIKRTHCLRSTIPIPWPTQEKLEILVAKSSGQFIYASTVVKFIESSRRPPSECLNIILGVSPRGKMNPFAELDALYNHILSSVDDIQLTLRVLSLIFIAPNLKLPMSPELFLSLEPGDIQRALINLSSILTYNEEHGEVEILHASFADFLSDQRRSTVFYIDKASSCVDFICRILHCVKVPDGIQAGDIRLLSKVTYLFPSVPKGHDQLQSDVLNFDIEAFISATAVCCYEGHRLSMDVLEIWPKLLDVAGIQDSDREGAQDRLNKSTMKWFQAFKSYKPLQLLLTLIVADVWDSVSGRTFSFWRYVDILSQMDEHCHIHHAYYYSSDRPGNSGTRHHLLSDDEYASASLHCMRFLSNPPQCFRPSGICLNYTEWKEACKLTFEILFQILQRANTLPELVQFISKHDIHPAVQRLIPARRICDMNEIILDFLSRANVCTAIQRSCDVTDQLLIRLLDTQEWWQWHGVE